MQVIAHFTVGISIALLILTFVDWRVSREFVLIFLSGFWGVIPDFHWILRRSGFQGIATTWKTFHQSDWANLFWFHQIMDSAETGQKDFEAAISLLVLGVSVIVYHRYNDWYES